ncbi:MAG: NADPH-dependent FMN reductase, partial [Myxococcota bacterium]
GSLQPASSNAWLLARFAAGCAPGTFETFDRIRDIPHFDPTLDVDPVPEAVVALRAALRASDAVLFASPEYGHGMPGSLKNALDWLVGSGEIGGKPVAITCAAQGPERGRKGLAMLRQTLEAIDTKIVWDEPIVVARAAPEEERIVAVDRALGPLRIALREACSASTLSV